MMNIVGVARAIADLARGALAPAEARRGPGRHVHDHEPRPVRIADQPCRSSTAERGNPRARRHPASARRDRGYAIAVRHMVYVSMSWDHRVIDGEIATRFLARIKQNLETWDFAEDLGIYRSGGPGSSSPEGLVPYAAANDAMHAWPSADSTGGSPTPRSCSSTPPCSRPARGRSPSISSGARTKPQRTVPRCTTSIAVARSRSTDRASWWDIRSCTSAVAPTPPRTCAARGRRDQARRRARGGAAPPAGRADGVCSRRTTSSARSAFA